MLLISCIWCLALLCHLISLDMLCVNATCSVSNYHICELCIAILLQDIIYVNCTTLSCCKGIIYVNYAMPCFWASYHICELCTAMEPGIIYVNYLMPSFFSLCIPFVDNLCILNYSSCVSAIWAGYGKIWSENKVFRADYAIWRSAYLAGYG